MDFEKAVQSPLKTPEPEQPSTPPAEGERPHMRPSLPSPELWLEWTTLKSRAGPLCGLPAQRLWWETDVAIAAARVYTRPSITKCVLNW